MNMRITRQDELRITARTIRAVKGMWPSKALVQNVTVVIDRNGWAVAHYGAHGRYWCSYFDGAGDCFATSGAESRGKPRC